jgi:hypothetical protein
VGTQTRISGKAHGFLDWRETLIEAVAASPSGGELFAGLRERNVAEVINYCFVGITVP